MKPLYLELADREFEEKIEALFDKLKSCSICPRNCKVDRTKGQLGYCKTGFLPFVSSYGPHFGEESVLVGFNGSGTIFFTSCNLGCIFCQNYEISQLRIGDEISFEDLARIMIKLQQLGCHNINLVSPTHQIPQIVKSLKIARSMGLKIPIVYNTNAYDSVETLKILEGIIDIYMPDAKYSDNNVARELSDAPSYFEVMKEAIKEMQRQVGDLLLNGNGIAVRGLIVRHLVLPNELAGSELIFKFLSQSVSKNVFLNIMDQYRPCFKATLHPKLSRRITKEEFKEAVKLAKKYGLTRIYKE
jgi:putative pyruvate formate lyase activating enzyme